MHCPSIPEPKHMLGAPGPVMETLDGRPEWATRVLFLAQV